MTYVKVKGFKIFSDRHGKLRCYHRKSGTPIDLSKGALGTAEFFAECELIRTTSEKDQVTKPGTLGLLIEKYRGHPAFTDLAVRTKADYQRVFNYLLPIADTQLQRFTSPLVVKLRDKASVKHGRRFANYVRTVLSLLFSWGRERGYVRENPAAGIKGLKRPKDAPEANRPWSDMERDEVISAIPNHMKLPICLMMYCGLDPQDALKLLRTSIKDGKIDARRNKTGVQTWLPIPQPVLEALETAPDHNAITLCANSYGRPWTVSGFRASWRPKKLKLEESGKIQPGLTLKGLRHTVATILREMGEDERTIADMLGQKTTAMARHYSRRADKTKKLTGVVKDFEAEVNRRRAKSVKP